MCSLQSPSESLTTDSGSVADDAENNENEVGADSHTDMTDNKAVVKIDPDSKTGIKLEDVKRSLHDNKPDLPLKVEDLKDPALLNMKKEDGLIGSMPPMMNVGLTVMPVSTSTDGLNCKEGPGAPIKLEPGVSRAEDGQGQFTTPNPLPNPNSVPGPNPLPGHCPMPVSLPGQMPAPLPGQVCSILLFLMYILTISCS